MRLTSVQLTIQNMSCGSCVGRVDKALRDIGGVQDVAVNLASEMARIEFDADAISVIDLKAGLISAGYPGQEVDHDATDDRETRQQAEQTTLRNAVILAVALGLPVFILEMGSHVFPALHHLIHRTIGLPASWSVQFVLTAALLLGPGRRFFTKGIPALVRRSPDMNSLVALGAGAAFLFSTVVLIWPSAFPAQARAVYFESAAVIVVLILVGRWLEARAKGRTGAAIQRLVGLQPQTARIKRNNDWVDVPFTTLKAGDVFLVRPGERIAADGVILEGRSDVDQSMMTGEAMPVAKAAGDQITGATINGTGSLTCRVTVVGQDATLNQIIGMVQDAQSAQLPVQSLVDRITLWFVPAVLVIAALTVLIWLIFGPDPVVSYALVAGVSVLIIACPCAMGLATPTSIMVGTGRAAELGVLFRRGDGLQRLEETSVVAFDKTGTLTMGAPKVVMFEVAPAYERDITLAKIAAVEAASEHPLAHAIVQAAAGLVLPKVLDVHAHGGLGVSGTVDGQTIKIGKAAWLRDLHVDLSIFEEALMAEEGKGHTVFFVAIEGEGAAMIAVADPLKPQSFETIRALKAQGVRVAMVTGDSGITARNIADQLGIEEVIADVLPDGKVAALEQLRPQTGALVFVGDGINDAPALAYADVGIALGTGTDVAIETADVVLMAGDPSRVVTAIEASRATLRNIRQNLFWAFGYNVLLIPVAAGVLFPFTGLMLSPALAAGAMALSSVFVLSNALRLRKLG